MVLGNTVDLGDLVCRNMLLGPRSHVQDRQDGAHRALLQLHEKTLQFNCLNEFSGQSTIISSSM